MQFTSEELQAIYQLLGRVQIQGNEAKAVVLIQQKIEQLVTPKKEETSKPKE